MALSFSEAKNIPIIDYLSRLGCEASKIRGNDYWYHSPFRIENNPSFKVNAKLNLWYDHGIGEGGTLLDLGVRLHQCSIHEFMLKLSHAGYLGNDFSLHKKQSEQPEIRLEILSVKELTNTKLIDYINGRGIKTDIAKQYCKEVDFRIGLKSYNAIGFPNISGGYELRNGWFKGSSSPKDISLIDNQSNRICVQEGFIDFLTVIQLSDKGIKSLTDDSNFLILNSLSFLNKNLSFIKAHDEIILFLDNDDAGRKAKDVLILKGISFQDASVFYASFKDINEFLLNKIRVVPISIKSKGMRP